MTDLPTLIANDMPDYWAAGDEFTIRTGSDLPTVTEPWEPHTADPVVIRPLRAGDRVELATFCMACIDVGCPTPVECDNGTCGPFATATVTVIESMLDWETDGADNHYLVTVTNVEALT